MADIFDVVADLTRRELLQLLLQSGEISVGEIVERTSLTQPTVSKHLKVLRDHGIVRVREEGQHRYYTLDAGPLEELETWVVPFLGSDFEDAPRDQVASSSAQPERSAVSAAIAAWPGSDAGERVGRVVADGSFKALSRIHDAQDELTRRIHRATGR
ncbi:MAG TPA: metalloregulator ArsR/SmtB family transcription factor [Galbitalea sp.]|jgi:DNA-binding transcriptional ArsR family regulator